MEKTQTAKVLDNTESAEPIFKVVKPQKTINIIKNGTTAGVKADALFVIGLTMAIIFKNWFCRQILLGLVNDEKMKEITDPDLKLLFKDYKGQSYGFFIQGQNVITENGMVVKAVIDDCLNELNQKLTADNVTEKQILKINEDITIVTQQKGIIMKDLTTKGNGLKDLMSYGEQVKIYGNSRKELVIQHRTAKNETYVTVIEAINACNKDFILEGESQGLSGASASINPTDFCNFYVEKGKQVMLVPTRFVNGKEKDLKSIRFGPLVFNS